MGSAPGGAGNGPIPSPLPTSLSSLSLAFTARSTLPTSPTYPSNTFNFASGFPSICVCRYKSRNSLSPLSVGSLIHRPSSSHSSLYPVPTFPVDCVSL
ncbi:hypothetical protein BDZ91DRAFT_709079 [Kalaharituber pfeilii]|nr:hypothetical protein BDZ91DRAFT_709079 [Kalaharituber pfeilii]